MRGIRNQLLPSIITFPGAKELTVLNWDGNAVYYNLSRCRFPNIERINFLSCDTGSYQVLFRFFDTGICEGESSFKWGVDKLYYPRYFDELKPEYVIKLNILDRVRVTHDCPVDFEEQFDLYVATKLGRLN